MSKGNYSFGMKSRFAFGLSMRVECDTCLVSDTTAVDNAIFRAKSKASAIVVSHGLKLLCRICTSGAFLEGGHLTYCEQIGDAIEHHEYNMGSSKADEA